MNFKCTFSATPSSITITRDGGYNWDTAPTAYAAQPYGFDCYGNSNSITQGSTAYAYGHYYAY